MDEKRFLCDSIREAMACMPDAEKMMELSEDDLRKLAWKAADMAKSYFYMAGEKANE